MTVADLSIGEKGHITKVASDQIPLKLLEMGCLPGNEVVMLQKAPFNDPVYVVVNDSHVAIRHETAMLIQIEKEGTP